MPIVIQNQNVVFSYLYVDDLIRIVEHFINHEGKHRFYNIIPDETVDLLTIARIIQDVADEEVGIQVKNEGMGLEYSGDNRRLKKEIPDLGFTEIKEGITNLYSWYNENKQFIDKGRLI